MINYKKAWLNIIFMLPMAIQCFEIKNAKRIAIIGNAGSGKSTLAKKIHENLNLPLYHLDQYCWKKNWTRPDGDEYQIIHHSLCDQDKWIIEGASFDLLEYRIKKADMVIFLDIQTHTCLWRVLQRTIRNYGESMSSNAEGCVTRVNWVYINFLKGIYKFKARYLPQINNLLQTYSGSKEIYILTSPQEVDTFIAQLEGIGSEQVVAIL